jgi:chromosome segregation ATPase
VGRFDRDESGRVPAALGTATDELRATVETKLHEIVEAAEARAHEIEDRALEQALEVQQDSERKARERFERSAERTRRLVAAIDAFERELSEALGSLRTTADRLASELDGLESSETTVTEDEAPAEAPEPLPPDERELVRRRILDLFLAGKPRVEAERMLTQLEDGGRYIDLLEEVYESRSETQQGTSRRGGGRRRRRPGAP